MGFKLTVMNNPNTHPFPVNNSQSLHATKLASIFPELFRLCPWFPAIVLLGSTCEYPQGINPALQRFLTQKYLCSPRPTSGHCLVPSGSRLHPSCSALCTYGGCSSGAATSQAQLFTSGFKGMKFWRAAPSSGSCWLCTLSFME